MDLFAMIMCGLILCGQGLSTTGILPPAQKLYITNAKSTDEVRKLCKKPDDRYALACAYAYDVSCWIVIAPTKDIEAQGLTRDIAMRHELGHCNGWSGEHNNARAVDWRRYKDTKQLTAKPVEPTKPIEPVQPVALSEDDIEGIVAAWGGEEALQAYAKRNLQRAFAGDRVAIDWKKDKAEAEGKAKAKAADRKHFDSETLWNAIGKAAIQDAIDWKKKAAAQTSEPTTQDNLGAAIAREPMQNAVFDKAWPQGGLVISLRSSLSSIVGIPRPPSHIIP
jgi:hypothetical protein